MIGLITVLFVLVVVGLAFFLYRSPTAPPAMTEAEEAQTEAEAVQETEAMFDAFGGAVVQGDAQTVASSWTSDAVMLEPGIRVEGSGLPPLMDEVVGTHDYGRWDYTILHPFSHGDIAYALGAFPPTLP
jgi:ketosteroid isomerase-like protein